MARIAILLSRGALQHIAAAMLALLLAATTPARAQISWHMKSTFEPTREVWTGTEGFRNVMSIYGGGTMAPFGTLAQDGLRLRAVAGISRYSYNGPRYSAAVGTAVNVDFRGESHFLEALVGYQWRAGDLTMKAFAGVAFSEHVITPFDAETVIQGKARGAKGAIEAWYSIANHGYASLDLALSEAHRAYSARLRLGIRAGARWSAGPELQRTGHLEADSTRLGAFARYDYEGYEVTVSGGVFEPAAGVGGAYLAAQFLMRF